MRKVPLLLSVCLFLLQAEETSMVSPLKNFSLSASISNFNSKSHETVYMPVGYPDTITHWSHHENTNVDNVSLLVMTKQQCTA